MEYEIVKKQWNEIFSNAIARTRNWQIIAFISLTLNVFLVFGLIAISNKSTTVPYIVEVDNLGRAVASAPALETKLLDDKIVRAYLYRFLDLSRSVVSDSSAIRNNLSKLFLITSNDVKNNFLEPYYLKNNIFKLSTKISRQVVPVAMMKQGDNSYLVEWNEIIRNKSQKIIRTEKWKAIISIKRIGQDQIDQQIEYDPENPFGIYIQEISWDKIN